MSLLRSPSKTATGSSSQPDLSKLNVMETDSSITFRKRKQPFDHECKCSKEIQEMRTQLTHMTTLLEKYTGSNEQIINNMQDNISEVKTHIAEIKSSNEQTFNMIQENITEIKTQINDIKSWSTNIKSEQNNIKTKIISLEKKVCLNENKLKSLESSLTTFATPTPTGNKLQANEQLIREIQDRRDREKNIIIVGLPEQNSETSEERYSKDETEVMRITSLLDDDIPKPIKVIRIGKYNPAKDRRIKVCYDKLGPAKQLLRHKSKLPENIKIFSDQTPAQQKYLQTLKEELTRRSNEGESDLTIKYINGMPKIIKTSTKNFSQ